VCLNYLYPVFFCAALAPDMSQVRAPNALHPTPTPCPPTCACVAGSGRAAQWQVGYFVDVGMNVAGWVGVWAAIGAACSGMNNFMPQMSTTSRGLRFTALYRIIPLTWLGRNWERYNTPLAAILTQGVLIAVLMTFGFDVLVTINVLFYNVGLLLQFAAFLRLRYTQPELKRPFVVPGGLPMAWGLMVTITVVVAIGFYAAVTTAWWAMVTVVAANLAFVALGFAWRRWAYTDTLVDEVDAREEVAQAHRAKEEAIKKANAPPRAAALFGGSWLQFDGSGSGEHGADSGSGHTR
jgi:amino acid transporter